MQSHATLESNLSLLSSLKEDFRPDDFILPHYKEAYRLAIDCLVSGGSTKYNEFIQTEKIASFLSEDEIQYITQNAKQLPINEHLDDLENHSNEETSTGTYWPTHSDAAPPDLELGWPEVMHTRLQTNVDLLHHPPRLNNPTIKEVFRKHIQDARKVIAIAMDVFTDVDIFKELVDASVRGVPVYILLDHLQFKSFLNMATNLDIQIPKLRNMRVRTVKGHEYVCKSGAKFYGAMDQKFALIDCHTVFFGSYSFMWSYEKLHLSMVQVITGKLVDLYDEEFRTLYARSTIPAEFQPQESFSENRPNGKTESYISHSVKPFERKDHLRHTLDTVYKQTCERQPGFKTTLEEPLIPINIHSRLLQESMDYNKRHSYAGERREPSYMLPHYRHGNSNWNVAEESRGYGGNHYTGINDNTYENSRINLINRSTNMRQSFNGSDKHVLSMQQNLPTLAKTSKSFLRTWRIETYLNNTDAPTGESYDYVEQHEMDNNAIPSMPSRIRSSLVFRSIIPEDPEPNSYTKEPICDDGQFGGHPDVSYYSSSQWNQKQLMDPHNQPDDYNLKRRSIQISDHIGNQKFYGSGRDAIYASLGRAKFGFKPSKPEILKEALYKRHSVADPRHSTFNSNSNETFNHIYGSLLRSKTEKRTVAENAIRSGYTQNLKEDQRSISHYDFKKAESKEISKSIWKEPPFRTVSSTVLEVDDKERTKPSAMSPRFFKNSTKKIKSLLNIPSRKEGSHKGKNASIPNVGDSSETITFDDSEHRAYHEENHLGSTTFSMKSTDSTRLKKANGKISGGERYNYVLTGDSSAPRFSTEELQSDGRTSEQLYFNYQKDSVRGTSSQWQREQSGTNRSCRQYEPHTFENNQVHSGSRTTVLTNTYTPVKLKGSLLTRGNTTNELSHGHETKIGRLIQRKFGNFLNKNK